jgi:AcrR family transcriptional regulator
VQCPERVQAASCVKFRQVVSGSAESCLVCAAMPRPLPTQPRSKERVEAIFEATRALLREGGIASCTVAGISAQAEISPASLYRYFPDSTAVIYALANTSLDQVHNGLRELLGAIKSRRDIEPTMTRALQTYFSYFAEDRALRELWFGTLADPQLAKLNIEDSKRNGNLFAETLSTYSKTPIPQLRDKWFLLSHMIGASIGLCLDLSTGQSKRLRKELEKMLAQAVEIDLVED